MQRKLGTGFKEPHHSKISQEVPNVSRTELGQCHVKCYQPGNLLETLFTEVLLGFGYMAMFCLTHTKISDSLKKNWVQHKPYWLHRHLTSVRHTYQLDNGRTVP